MEELVCVRVVMLVLVTVLGCGVTVEVAVLVTL